MAPMVSVEERWEVAARVAAVRVVREAAAARDVASRAAVARAAAVTERG